MTCSSQRGASSVEHVALVLLAVAVAIAGVTGARLAAADDPTPDIASALLRKQRCAVHYPDPCWQDPLTEAYGRVSAGAVRALAPAPEVVDGLVGVDYRRCRQARCARPGAGGRDLHLTVGNRRTAAFTSIREPGADGAAIGIDYWIYRPTAGWQLLSREVDAATRRRLGATALPDHADPKLIPLETLLGRDEASFRTGEEPPWRGLIESRWGR